MKLDCSNDDIAPNAEVYFVPTLKVANLLLSLGRTCLCRLTPQFVLISQGLSELRCRLARIGAIGGPIYRRFVQAVSTLRPLVFAPQTSAAKLI